MTANQDRDQGLARHYRRGLVAVPLLMAAALVTTVIIGYRNVKSVLATVERGQGDGLLHAVRRALRPGQIWDAQTLTDLLAENSDAGLRCIAAFEPRHFTVIAFVGDCRLEDGVTSEAHGAELSSRLRATPPDRPVAIGTRLRMTAYRLPPRRGDRSAPATLPEPGHDPGDERRLGPGDEPPDFREEHDPSAERLGPGDEPPDFREEHDASAERLGPGDEPPDFREEHDASAERLGPGDEPPGRRAGRRGAAGERLGPGPGGWGPRDGRRRRPEDRRDFGRRLLEGIRRGAGELPALLIEYEPVQTAALERGARRTLAVGGAVSLALVIAALALLRISRRAERDREQRERDRRLASLGEMSAVLAHEIRNPLASMKGHAQLLAEQLPAGSREHDKATRVVHEIERLESLTNDLLDFVRAPHLERSRVVPAELLREAAEAVSGEIQIDVARAPHHWTLDGGRMRQVLVNLLTNAVQASPEGQPPAALVEVKTSDLVFTIRDHGDGIAAADRERMFEPFQTTRVRGTGLGLAVADRIVKLHGGSITADNHPDGGAVFRVRIPAGGG